MWQRVIQNHVFAGNLRLTDSINKRQMNVSESNDLRASYFTKQVIHLPELSCEETPSEILNIEMPSQL